MSNSEKSDDAKEHRRDIERSLYSIEECCAELVVGIGEINANLERLRSTAHKLVEKMVVLDDLGNSLDAVTALAKTMSELAPKVGHLLDRVERLEERRG